MEPIKHSVLYFSSLICFWSVLVESNNLHGKHSGELISGHLIIPRKVNHNGEFLSYNLTHHNNHSGIRSRHTRSAEVNSQDLHYNLELNNETLHLELRPHNQFFTSNLLIERHRRDLRIRKTPSAKNTNCHYLGKIRGHSASKVALSSCGGLVGHIKTKNSEYYIEPSKHHDAHPTNGHPHVVFHRSAVRQEKKRRHRHRNGKRHHQKNHHHQHQPQSNCGTKEPRRRTETRIEWQPQGKVIVQGGRKIRRHHHPYPRRSRYNRLAKSESHAQQPTAKFQYQTSEEVMLTNTTTTLRRQRQHQNHRQRQGSSNILSGNSQRKSTSPPTRTKRSISSPRHVETLIVADSTMVAFHDDIETYLLTIMNMVSSLYKDPSIGNLIEVVVVKIILLDEDEAHPDLNLTENAQRNLDTFCGWQHKLNTGNETDPYHHDVAILITRKNICGNNCMTLGLANVGGMCKPKQSCSVNEDNGIMLSHTIAHELGHNFGMFHDTAKIGCHGRVGPIVHIMTPTFVADTLQVSWSNCSRKFITHFLDQGLGDCLDDTPESKEQYEYPELPAGAMYNAELQCRLQYNFTDDNVVSCSSLNEICSQLWCKVNGECVTNMRPTAPGTNCGKHMWCQNGECVPMEEITPRHGGWGNWSEWSKCSRTCGGGVSIQYRGCNNPVPANGGLFCIGERKRYKICNKHDCSEDEVSFRAQQCSNFNDVPYQGGTYKWLPFFDKYNPCKLFCTDVDDTVIANWGDVVADGTPCLVGTKNMCIDGICKKVGCDWIVDSNTQEDRCGICGGTGDNCKPVKEIFNQDFNVTDGYVEIVTIPAKSRHITIKELANSPNFLSIGKANSSYFYLNGDRLISMPGEFEIAGIDSMYDREDEQETIKIPQPIEHSITLYVIVRGITENEGIYYEFTLPVTNSTPVLEYKWKLGDWTACSATCGGGVQYRMPLCYESDQLISEEELCWSNADNIRPNKISRRCNEIQCPTHWWIGPWQLCQVTCKMPGAASPVKRRSIMCLDQNDVILSETMCNNTTRPIEVESCAESIPACRNGDGNRDLTKNDIFLE